MQSGRSLSCWLSRNRLVLLKWNRLVDADAVERLETRMLVTSNLEGQRFQLRLAHPIYGDVIRARIPALRISKMARALAEVVESQGGPAEGGHSPNSHLEADRRSRIAGAHVTLPCALHVYPRAQHRCPLIME